MLSKYSAQRHAFNFMLLVIISRKHQWQKINVANNSDLYVRIMKVIPSEAGFILRKQIYAIYADHFAHVGRAFSATNADLRRSDRADAEYKHSYNTLSFTLSFARLLKL